MFVVYCRLFTGYRIFQVPLDDTAAGELGIVGSAHDIYRGLGVLVSHKGSASWLPVQRGLRPFNVDQRNGSSALDYLYTLALLWKGCISGRPLNRLKQDRRATRWVAHLLSCLAGWRSVTLSALELSLHVYTLNRRHYKAAHGWNHALRYCG